MPPSITALANRALCLLALAGAEQGDPSQAYFNVYTQYDTIESRNAADVSIFPKLILLKTWTQLDGGMALWGSSPTLVVFYRAGRLIPPSPL